MYSLRHIALFASLGLAATGCLKDIGDNPGPEPMCVINTDCDHLNGEICDDGTCWGNPPDTSLFAVKLEPPSERSDELVVTELPLLSITTDGNIEDLVFTNFVTLRGRVLLACDGASTNCDADLSVATTIQVRRPSRFPGGPAFVRNIKTDDKVSAGSSAFEIRLPITQPGEPPYEITIIPDSSSDNSGESPAHLAPPSRFTLTATEDRLSEEWVIGDPNQHKLVTGRVVDAVGQGLANMQVTAFGRWSQGAPLEKASSIGVTDNTGAFTIRIPVAMLDLYDLVVSPVPGYVAPTLHKSNVFIADPSGQMALETVTIETDLQMPSYAEAVSFVVPVKGFDGSGNQEDVVGASVKLVTVLQDDGDTRATFTSEALTDDKGDARLWLIPGGVTNRRAYIASITPPPGSLHGSLFEIDVQVGAGNPVDPSFLPALALPRRVAVKGKLVGANGTPVGGATVTATVSLAFKWQLPLPLQSALDPLEFDQATTDNNGKFLLWLDPALLGQTPKYDLSFVPPFGAGVPWWTKQAVTVDSETIPIDGLDLGDITLPAASFARGWIVAPDNTPVGGGTLRLFQIPSDQSVCEGAILPAGEDTCEAPAVLRGIWQADENGYVTIVLPEG